MLKSFGDHSARVSPDADRPGEFRLSMRMNFGNVAEPRIVAVGGLTSEGAAFELAERLSGLFDQYDVRAVLNWK